MSINLNNIILDDVQTTIFNYFLSLKQDISSYYRKKLFFSFRRNIPKSVYLYGPVGRGKSLIVKMFYDQIDTQKKFISYNKFMGEIHQALKKVRSENVLDPIGKITHEISKEFKLLCIDEFEVKDIADAMILGSLITNLIKNEIIIVLTSNRKPNELYKEGLQREYFSKTIKFIEDNFTILELNSPKDYRLNLLKSTEVYFIKNNDKLEELILKLSKQEIKSEKLTILAREIHIEKYFEMNIKSNSYRCAIFDFNDLCKANLGSADYNSLSMNYKFIIIKNIPILTKEDRNEALRFIKLIDILYENKNILICSAEAPIEELYLEGDNVFEFKRTISRLNEMQSGKYLNELF